MKNITIISSSPRKQGNSDILCDEFIRGAKVVGNKTEKIYLKDKKINYCTGCGYCYNTHKCSQNDDMSEVLNSLINADIIVFASPIYFYTICGQLKTMIDRCCSRYTEIRNKEFYFIFTAADTNKESTNKAMIEMEGFLECLEGCKYKSIISGIGAWEKGDIKASPSMQEAYNAGKSTL